MPGKRLPMRKIRDVLRLCADGLSKRQIAASLNVGATSVGEYLRRARRAGLNWPLPADVSDEDLDRRLFPARRRLPRTAVRFPTGRACIENCASPE